jgi:O-antigen/teichoic acid export membrane protein
LKRKFFTNILILLSLNLAVKAFWVLGIDRTVQNVAGAELYGFYFSLFNFSLLFSILLDFGLTNYNNRNISREPALISSLLGNMIIIRILFSLIYGIVSFSIAVSLGYSGRQLNMLWFLLFNQFIASFILYLRSNISGLQLFITDSFLSVSDRLLMIVVCGIILWSGLIHSPFRIEWFVYAQTLSYLITFLVAFTVVRLKGKVRKLAFDKMTVLKILRESFPFALVTLFMTVYWRVDTVMLERMLPDGHIKVGIYAQSFRLLDAAAMIPNLFAVILLPLYSKMLMNNEDISQILRLSSILLITPLIIITIPLIFCSQEIMEILYRSYITESSRVFTILMIGIIPVSVVYIYSTVLTANGNLKFLLLITGGGVLLNIILNLFLIPSNGPEGAALARVITQSLIAAACFVMVCNQFSIRSNKQLIIKMILLTLLMVLIGFLNKTGGYNWETGFIIQFFAGIFIALVTKLIDLQAFSNFFIDK